MAQRLKGLFPDADVIRFKSGKFSGQWRHTKNIICIMATGIVVRTVAPLLKDKKTDPAVVVIDEKGLFVISLLSGHIGGANALAKKIAGFLGAQPVITTASDLQGRLALDLWAIENNLHIEDFEKLKKLSAKIVNGQRVKVKTDYPFGAGQAPGEFVIVESAEDAEVIITGRVMNGDALFLRPKNLFVGIGCNRGTPKGEIREALDSILQRERLSPDSIRCICTIDLKKDEEGLLDFAGDAGLGIEFFPNHDLNDTALKYNIKESKAVKAATGAVAVAEPAAISGAEKGFNDCALIIPKEKRRNVTLAIAEGNFTL